MKTQRYPYSITRHGEKIHGGTQSGENMEDALEKLKVRFKIVKKSNGIFFRNYLGEKPVSIAMFAAPEMA